MTYRNDCAEIWEIVAEKRAAKTDWAGMLTALNNKQILTSSGRTPDPARRYEGWSWG